MHTLYSMQDSGNCYKPRLLMAQLGVDFESVEVNAVDGTTKSDAYRAITPAGKVPFLKLADGNALGESNAMLVYLAEGTQFIPDDKFDRSKMFEWMFFEQYSHEPNIAVRRSICTYPERAVGVDEEAKQKLLDNGHKALAIMEQHLSSKNWLAGDNYSIADIALFAYTHIAHEGGFQMDRFPSIAAWLARIKAQDSFVGLDWKSAKTQNFSAQ